jgi:RNA-binding protein YlmH
MAEEKELQQLKKRLTELADRSYNHGMYTFTPFLGLSEQQAYHEIQSELAYAGCSMEGGCPLCERKMIRFGREEELGFQMPYPISCLTVSPLTPKFAEHLTHRDFLGAIMNLGIERDTVGDIFVQEKSAVLFCQDTIASYLTENLEKVRHTNVKCILSEVPADLQSPTLERVSLSVASVRLDGVISKLYNLARSQSLELFRAGRVFVNGRLMENNSYVLKKQDAVTVRGFGKFVYVVEEGETRKGKIRVSVDIYR